MTEARIQPALVAHGVMQQAEMRRAAAAAACLHGGAASSGSGSSGGGGHLSHNQSSAGGAAETEADFSRNFSRCIADATLTAEVCERAFFARCSADGGGLCARL